MRFSVCQVRGIYILSRGDVEVFVGDSLSKCLKTGDHFGASSLVKKFESPKLLCAKTFAEVLYIDSNSFRGIAQRHLTSAECQKLFDDLKEAVKNSDDTVGPTALQTGSAAMKRRTSSVQARELLIAAAKMKNGDIGSLGWFLPGSKFRTYWDIILLIGNLAYHMVTPLLLAGTLHDNFGFDDFGNLL